MRRRLNDDGHCDALATNVHVAFLRGVNVGGWNKLPMKDLASMFRAAGCGDVRTYIQSGNVVFQADSELASRAPSLITESIADRFGYTITVIQRSATELLGAVRANPFAHADAEIGQLHAVFLACAPSPALVDGLDPDRSPGDSFTVVDREIFLHCPRGLSRTKFTNNWFDSRLRTISTMRNWRTTLNLLELATG